jgi:LacI family transcriptional regulator
MNIHTIAKLSGVSVSTVSRILNNKPDVNPKTRDNVLKVMNDTGYSPMVTVNRQEKIGVVTPFVFLPEFVGDIMTGIMETAYSYGKALTLIPSTGGILNEHVDLKHYCRINGLCGLIFIAPPADFKFPKLLVQERIPHVIVASTYEDEEISWVDVTNERGVKEAVNHLIENGHRRIGLINSNHDTQCLIDRTNGYYEAFEKYGMKPNQKLIIENFERGKLFEAVDAMLNSATIPTALICTTHRETLGILEHLKSNNVKVPEDISLIGFGDYQVSPLTNPPITTIHQPVYELGRTAVKVFEELCNQDVYCSIQKELPTRLIIRQSTKKLTENNAVLNQ